MPKGDLNNMIKLSLRSTGERMIELSDQIVDGGGTHLSSGDRKLVKMAMVPALEESFSELIHFFLMDNRDMQAEAFSQMDRLLGLKL